MQRMRLLVPAFLLLAALPSGCSRQAPAPVEPPELKNPGPAPAKLPPNLDGAVQFAQGAVQVLEASKQAQYESALQDAFNLLAQRKYPEALTALETARTLKDTPFLQIEIGKLKVRIDQDAAAERTVQDLQTVLDQGKAAEAGQLATLALQQYGACDVAPRLVKLKLQADALTATQLTDNAARQQRFRDEAAAAVKEKNLRAAALACEQALQYGDDANLRRQLDDVKASLKRYDENRARAAELRRDPAAIEDALALLNDAAKAWDTLQVRQEIDEYTVALQQRRERVSVADFEVRGEVGIPAAGQTLADELLPALKPKFDLVERSQIAKVLGELKLTSTQLADSGSDQRELGRLAKLRYLVVGSISQIGGITVHARLVDVRTGLIVQTAKVVAPEPNQLVALMPELARLLMMTDEQRLAYEKEQMQVAKMPPPPPADAPLPPPPEPLAAGQPPPPPIVLDTPRPVELGGVVLLDFERLPPPPAAGQPVRVIEVGAEIAVKRRLLAVSLEVGDNLFRRGRFREAMRHFEFGLSLSPGHFDLQVRLDRCRPLLPPAPPPLVVVVAEPPPPPRPRVAFLDFVVLGDPAAVPPPLGAWTPQNLAPYFSPPYEIVDRGEVCWYMGRTGMTMRDLMTDPAARRWLGRALNVRYFVLGNIRQTASFDVSSYLLDAEDGYLVGSGRIHVQDPYELKLRLWELARLTLMSPAERQQYENQTQPYQALIVQARQCNERGEFALAINLFGKASALRPGSIEIEVHLNNSRRAAERAALEEARRREAARIEAEALAWQQRQLELARRAEEARQRAAAEFAALDAARRRAIQEARQRELALAQNQLTLQARIAFKRGDFQLSLRLFEGASGLRPDDGVYRELAQARAELDRVAQQRAAEEQALREAQLRRQREDDLTRVRKQLDAEREARRAQELALRQAQEARDGAEYQRLFDEGQRRLNRAEYDAAIGRLQTARRLKKTDAVEALLNQAMTNQARAIAQKQGEAERRALEARLARERELRLQAEAEAKRNQELYTQALQLAQKAMAEKNYDVACIKYQEAGKVYKTDLVLTGIRQAEAARAEVRTQAALEIKRKTEAAQATATVQRLVGEGHAALAAGQHDKAVQAFTQAKTLAPANVEVLAGLSKAEQTRERAALEIRRQAQAEKARQQTVADAATAAEAKRKADAYQKAMSDGRLALSGKQYDAAIKSFADAQRILPGDQSAANFLKDAQKAKSDAVVAAQEDLRKAQTAKQVADAALKPKQADAQRAEQVRQFLNTGRTALKAGQFDAAARAFADADRLAPKDVGVAAAMQELDQARRAAAATAAVAAEKAKAQTAYQQAIASGQQALAGKRYDDAVKAFADAGRVMPGDPTAASLLKQAEKARLDARAAQDVDAKKKAELAQKQADFNRLLQQGQAAMAGKRYDEAVQILTQAGQVMPGDPTAANLLNQARAAAQQARVAQDLEAKQKAAAAQRQADFNRLTGQGQAAMTAKRYVEAVKAYTDALQVIPGEPLATQRLREASAALAAASKPAPPPPPQTNPAYIQQMQAGAALEKQQKFADALKAYQAALKIVPGDAKATERVRYATSMAEGQRLHAARRFADAVREYEAALRVIPNDPAATAALKRAKAGQQ